MPSKFTAIVLCLSASVMLAEEPQKLLDSLRAELRAEIKSLAAPKNEQDDTRKRSLQSLFFSLSRDSNVDQPPSVILNALAQAQKDSPSEKLRDLCAKSAVAIQAQAERESVEFEKRLHDTVRSALERGLAATSAKELDAPLAELTALSADVRHFDTRNSPDRPHQRLLQNVLNAATSILSAYQDGFFAKLDVTTIQNHSAPSQILESWTSDGSNAAVLDDIIPREALREKIRAAAARIPFEEFRRLSDEEYHKKLLELIAGVSKLEDLDGAFEQIDALKSRQKPLGGQWADNSETRLLREDYKVYCWLRSGMETDFRLDNVISPANSNKTLVTIKRLLTRYALAQVLKSSPALPQKEDESTTDFLRRVLTTACAQADWQTVPRVLGISLNLRLEDLLQQNDRMGFKFLLEGVDMERAGVPSEAAKSYLTALQSGSTLIPTDDIRSRLKTIHQRYPDAFDGVIPEGPTVPKQDH